MRHIADTFRVTNSRATFSYLLGTTPGAIIVMVAAKWRRYDAPAMYYRLGRGTGRPVLLSTVVMLVISTTELYMELGHTRCHLHCLLAVSTILSLYPLKRPTETPKNPFSLS